MPSRGSLLRRAKRQEFEAARDRDQMAQYRSPANYNSQLDNMRKRALADGVDLQSFWDYWNKIINFEISIYAESTASEQQYHAEKALFRRFWPRENFTGSLTSLYPGPKPLLFGTEPSPKLLEFPGTSIPTGPRGKQPEIRTASGVKAIPTGPRAMTPDIRSLAGSRAVTPRARTPLEDKGPSTPTNVANTPISPSHSISVIGNPTASTIAKAQSLPGDVRVEKRDDLYRPRYTENQRADYYGPEANPPFSKPKDDNLHAKEYNVKKSNGIPQPLAFESAEPFAASSSISKPSNRNDMPQQLPWTGPVVGNRSLVQSPKSLPTTSFTSSSNPQPTSTQHSTIPGLNTPHTALSSTTTANTSPSASAALAEMKRKVIESQNRKKEQSSMSPTWLENIPPLQRQSSVQLKNVNGRLASTWLPRPRTATSSDRERRKTNQLEEINRLIANQGKIPVGAKKSRSPDVGRRVSLDGGGGRGDSGEEELLLESGEEEGEVREVKRRRV